MKFTCYTLTLLVLVFLSAIDANDETPYPLGTSDLVPHPEFNGLKTNKIIENSIEPTELRLDYETFEFKTEFDESSIAEFHCLADQLSISALKKENKELKERVAGLESRIARLEELLTKTGVNQSR